MFDIIHEIGQTLRNNRLRTMLTGLAVAWGIFILIMLLGAARGVVNAFQYNFRNDDSNVLQVWGGRTSKPYKGYKDGRWVGLKDGDIETIEHNNSATVSQVTAYASVDTAKIATERDYVAGGFEAVFPDAFDANNHELLYGRRLNQQDMKQARRVMVICDRDARLLFGDASKAVGGTVRSLGLAWTVVGVYTNRWRTQAMVPYTTYKSVTGNNNDVYTLRVHLQGLKTEQDGEDAEQAVRATLATAHEFAPDDPNAVWTWNRFTGYIKQTAAMGYLELAVWVIGIFTLLSGIVGVSNIMFVSVRERTHEIGIRRAIGAKPRNILVQILMESVAITGLFGYIGVFMGMIVLEVLKRGIGDNDALRNPTVDLNIAINVTIALIVAGCLAGLFPALKAIKVKPVEALRDE
ncbi:MAG: ABC transporter permease [Bacteroidales bacterium]|nr:ABC transporter permease [Bacteroidales bacterium]